MNDFKNSGFITPNDKGILADDDSVSIQRAVDAAAESGVNKVVIPRMNLRTGEARWVIAKSILLPSMMTVILDNCYMVMADDVTESFFRSANTFTDLGRTPEGELHHITLCGIGSATLDGGNKNALDETTMLKNGLPYVSCNHPILFFNVRHFAVENLTILNQRYWGMRLEYCKFGHIANIYTSVSGDRRNQDGINLRNGCNNIVIENISGQTGDDMIALSAIDVSPEVYAHNMEISAEEYALRKKYSLIVNGADNDIHTVVIRNITGAAICHPLVALRNNDGARLYNIIIENVMDSYFANPAKNSHIPRYGLIRIGNNFYYSERPSAMGETSDITVRNIKARYSLRAIVLAATLKNSHFSDISCAGVCYSAFSFSPKWAGEMGAKLENVTAETITVHCETPDAESCALDFADMREHDYIKGMYINNVTLDNKAIAASVGGRAEIKLDNVRGGEAVKFKEGDYTAAVTVNGREYERI